MVAGDGTVRVMDFGLASDDGERRWRRRRSKPAEPRARRLLAHDGRRPDPNRLADRDAGVHGARAVPRRPADARTDQFSFCVSLYEALYGERPFAADSLAALVEAVTPGGCARCRSVRASRPGCARSFCAGSRSNARTASRRWTTCSRRSPAIRNASAGACSSAPVSPRCCSRAARSASALLQSPGAAVCRNPVGRLAAVWELADADPKAPHPRRDAVRAAFLATGARRAADVWARTAAKIDDYARHWAEMYGETCEATHVRGEQSTEVLDLRMDCLDRDRDSLRALTDVLAAADIDMVSRAIDAAAALPDIARCADVAALRVVVPAPRDPLLRQQVDRLRQRIAEARALGDTGRWEQGIAKARPLLDEAAKLGYKPSGR